MNVFVVMMKEIIDNMRDRQTLIYALLLGPVLLPVLIGASLVTSLKQFQINFDQISELHVRHAELAPNLIEFLYSNNINAVDAPEDFEALIRRGDIPVVLEITDDFGEALRAGKPAPLTVHADESDKASAKSARKVVALLGGYGRVLDSLRMQHRGIDPAVFQSLKIIENDVSIDGVSGQIIASLLPFLFIVSMVMGGFYLAIDTTAGERERQSLEPLLTLPMSRSQIVLGKYGATASFVLLSASLTALSIYLLFPLIPIELLGGQIKFDGPTIGRAFLLASPLVLLVSALLVTVAAYTKSTKEAQTYLGLLMVIPMAPFFILQFINIKSAAVTMFLPMLSQYQLLEQAVLQESIPAQHVVLSVAGTLLATVILLSLAVRLYKRERLLF